MTYNFDEIINRAGTDSMKVDMADKFCNAVDAIPMWVADMDFKTPPFVTDTIRKRLEHGILGYTVRNASYYEAICRWNKEEYGVDITPEMISYVPGVVCGISMCELALTEKGDKILIMDPVYHPFKFVAETNQREIVTNHLVRNSELFEIDFDALEKDIQGCKLLILCNPHNPGGVCWTKEDLIRIADIAAAAGTIVVSDEIHCDMLFGERKHIPFASVSETAKNNCVTLQAPTKTFNLPGVVASQAIVYNPEIREKLFGYIEGTDMDLGNVFAAECVKACYSDEGREWKKQMLEYVDSNIDLLIERLAAECPKIKVMRPQASFLVFLDCREMGMSQKELVDFFGKKAHVAMNSGTIFGPGGEGYMRLNAACTRATMNKVLDQFRDAYKAL